MSRSSPAAFPNVRAGAGISAGPDYRTCERLHLITLHPAPVSEPAPVCDVCESALDLLFHQTPVQGGEPGYYPLIDSHKAIGRQGTKQGSTHGKTDGTLLPSQTGLERQQCVWIYFFVLQIYYSIKYSLLSILGLY